jgi:hypothetical protein
VSKDLAPNYVELEEGEGINLGREIQWLVDEFLPDDRYTGVLIFEEYGRAAGYVLMPLNEHGKRDAS